MLRRAFRAMVLVGAGAAFALLLPACGPIEYIAYMPFDATGAIAQAKTAKGEKFSPYETTAALEYQHKSRELAGYSRWHSAAKFARKSGELARKARQLAGERASLPAEQQAEYGVQTGSTSGGDTSSGNNTPVKVDPNTPPAPLDVKTVDTHAPESQPAAPPAPASGSPTP